MTLLRGVFMKKLILAIFFAVFAVSFGEIKDNIGLFGDTEKETINEIIEKIENEKELKIYLNTVIGQETYQLANPQKTVIITYQQLSKDVIITELKFTEDLGMSDKAQELDLMLDSLKDYVFDYNYMEYTKKLLEQVNTLIVPQSQDEKNSDANFPEDSGETKKNIFKKIFSKNP